MRWAPIHPRQLLALGLLLLAVMLATMLAAAPDLSTLDFSIGGAAETSSAPSTGQPTWVTDPLAPPLEDLAGAR
jgi:hypothetical protein